MITEVLLWDDRNLLRFTAKEEGVFYAGVVGEVDPPKLNLMTRQEPGDGERQKRLRAALEELEAALTDFA